MHVNFTFSFLKFVGINTSFYLTTSAIGSKDYFLPLTDQRHLLITLLNFCWMLKSIECIPASHWIDGNRGWDCSIQLKKRVSADFGLLLH